MDKPRMPKQVTVIAFPLFRTRLLGWPATVTLTAAECKALVNFHLGGVEALRRPGYSCQCKTIDSLFRKGLTDKCGFTDMGKDVAKTLAEGGAE